MGVPGTLSWERLQLAARQSQSREGTLCLGASQAFDPKPSGVWSSASRAGRLPPEGDVRLLAHPRQSCPR